MNLFLIFLLCFKFLLLSASSSATEFSPVSLLNVIKRGDLPALEACIQQGVDTDTMSSALIIAINYNSLEVVDRLLREESLIVPRDAFLDAVSLNNAAIVERLLEDERIDVNLENEHGQSPLHLLFNNGPKELFLKFFHDPRVDVNNLNSKGQTILHLAAKKNDNELVSELLKRPDVNLNLLDFDRKLPVAWAIDKNQPKNALALLNDPRIDFESVGRIENNRYFIKAVEKGQVEVVQRLVEINPDWQVKFFGGKCAIEAAKEYGLMQASAIGNLDLMRQLIETGTDYNAQNGFCGTALFSAVAHRKLESLNLLLQQENIIIPDDILLLSVDNYRNPEIVTRLLQDERVNVNGALETAIRYNIVEVAKVLIESPRIELHDLDRPALPLAILFHSKEILEALIQSPRIDINFRYRTGHTALFYAISEGKEEFALEFLKVPGIEVNLESDMGESALIVAIQKGQLRVVRALIAAGAEVRFFDRNDKSVLQYAEECGVPEIFEEIQPSSFFPYK